MDREAGLLYLDSATLQFINVTEEYMTAVQVAFRYGNHPGVAEMRGLDALREVYGIRRIEFNEADKTLRVEYDATRLNAAAVAALVRRAGVDVRERLTPV